MVIYDDAMVLENFIQKTIRVAQRLTACTLSEPTLHPPPAVSSVAFPAPEPMQVDSYHLTQAERQRRILHRLCLSSVQLPPQIAPLVRTTVQILTPQICVSAQVLIDSGSAGIHTIQGKPLGRGHIRHLSSTLKLRIGCLHTEEIVFMVVEGSRFKIFICHIHDYIKSI